MSISELLNKLTLAPETVAFEESISVIEESYDFTETAFANGDTNNEAGQNNGSCKIFAFGRLNNLSEEQTLHCFGDYYRHDVLGNPDGDDHQNIRNFIQYGWQGISFDRCALELK